MTEKTKPPVYVEAAEDTHIDIRVSYAVWDMRFTHDVLFEAIADALPKVLPVGDEVGAEFVRVEWL